MTKCHKLGGLTRGSPTLGPRIGTRPRPAGNRAAQQEVSLGRASEQSFTCCSASLALPPEPSPPPPPPPGRGKIVFHETGPWCQKGWGPLA